MKKYSFKLISASLAGLVMAVLFGFQAFAMTPTLSLVNNGYGTVQATVYGDPNSPVVLDYFYQSAPQLVGAGIIGYTGTSGYFSTQLNPNNYAIPNGAEAVVMVNGQESVPVIWQSTGGYQQVNTGYSIPSLSQTNATLTVGQSQIISITNAYTNVYSNNNQYYISNPSNGIVSASVSNSQITIYGQSVGSTAVSICSSSANLYGGGVYYNNGNSNGCATLYVTVSGGYYNNNNNNPYYYQQPNYYYPPTTSYTNPYNNNYYNTPISVSNSNVQLSSGASTTVSLYGGNNNHSTGYISDPFYISTPNNVNVATAILNGSTMTIYGRNQGSTTITVCQTGSTQCVNINVNVTAATYYNNNSPYTNYNYPPQGTGWYYSNTQNCWLHY